MNLGRGIGSIGYHTRAGILAPAATPAARFVPAGPKWQDSARTTPVTADGQNVGAWDDVSGNNRHLVNATGTKQPLHKVAQVNGKDVVRTDGVDDYLKATAFTLNQPWTIFCVVKPLRVSNFQVFWDGNTDLSGAGLDFSNGANNASLGAAGYFSTRAGNYTDGEVWWPLYNWSPNGLAPLPGLFSAQYNGASSWVRTNEFHPLTTSPGASNAGGFTLSIRGDNATLPAKADFVEVIIYNRALAAGEIAATLAYLNSVYNLFPSGVPPYAPLVVCHGNSLTWGSQSTSPGPYPGTTSWPSVLRNTYGSAIRVINIGVPGQTDQYLKQQYPYQVAPLYDSGALKRIAVYWEGVNYYAHIANDANAAYGQATLWNTAAQATGWYTIIATALRSTNGTLGTAYWDPANPTIGYQNAYNALVRANTAGFNAVVDVAARSEFSDPTNTTYFDVDHLHLKDAGYALVGADMKTAVLAAP